MDTEGVAWEAASPRHTYLLGFKRSDRATGQTQIHVQNKEMGRLNVPDREVPEVIHRERGAVHMVFIR